MFKTVETRNKNFEKYTSSTKPSKVCAFHLLYQVRNSALFGWIPTTCIWQGHFYLCCQEIEEGIFFSVFIKVTLESVRNLISQNILWTKYLRVYKMVSSNAPSLQGNVCGWQELAVFSVCNISLLPAKIFYYLLTLWQEGGTKEVVPKHHSHRK